MGKCNTKAYYKSEGEVLYTHICTRNYYSHYRDTFILCKGDFVIVVESHGYGMDHGNNVKVKKVTRIKNTWKIDESFIMIPNNYIARI